MLAVADASAALAWYTQALGATELWNLGSVVGMEIDGAPIFLGEPEQTGWFVHLVLQVGTARDLDHRRHVLRNVGMDGNVVNGMHPG